jgi:DNA-nicking Smr family endonuclease
MRDVTPLSETAPEPDAAPAAETPRISRPRASNPAPAKLLPELAPDAAPGLDRRSAERLKRGQLPIEARLDLHGLTQEEAHSALLGFLASAEARGLRCVLVITGKGFRKLGETGGLGILKSAVPRWLNEAPNRARVLAFSAAQPQHGGGGALYVLLRRRR